MMRTCLFVLSLFVYAATFSVLAHEEHGDSQGNAETKTLKGEVVDLMCYIDHGARGEKHAKCASTCIESGGPAGLLTEVGALYLIVGEHKPINTKLTAEAGKIVSLKGKVVERSGMKMIENAELAK